MQRLLLPGVRRVSNVEFELDGVKYAACTDAPLTGHALVKSGPHAITVQYEDAA